MAFHKPRRVIASRLCISPEVEQVVSRGQQEKVRSEARVFFTLGRIVSKHPIYDDTDLSLSEPAFGAKPSFGLHCGGRHLEERHQPDGEGDETFYKEHPSGREPCQ